MLIHFIFLKNGKNKMKRKKIICTKKMKKEGEGEEDGFEETSIN